VIAVLNWSLNHWWVFFALGAFGVFEGVRRWPSTGRTTGGGRGQDGGAAERYLLRATV
jgi:hypothetical protein